MQDVWMYRTQVSDIDDIDLNGFDVEATDGHIGKVDEASDDAGAAYMVVDTGFWIFGKKRLIPAGVVSRVDSSNRTIYLSLSKDQVKNAPDWREDWRSDDATKSSYGDYYSPYE